MLVTLNISGYCPLAFSPTHSTPIKTASVPAYSVCGASLSPHAATQLLCRPHGSSPGVAPHPMESTHQPSYVRGAVTTTTHTSQTTVTRPLYASRLARSAAACLFPPCPACRPHVPAPHPTPLLASTSLCAASTHLPTLASWRLPGIHPYMTVQACMCRQRGQHSAALGRQQCIMGPGDSSRHNC